MPQPGGHRDPGYLAGLIADEGVTVLHFVPSLLAVFLELPGVAERCRTLRRVFCSGEALSPELQLRFERLLDAELHNLYGPAEAAIEVTHWPCERGSDPRLVPIGRAIPNTQVYVLDDRLEPLGIGLPGEVYIGGVCVGRGYLNRPALTAERFVPDPFARRPGSRLYRTGDRARVRPDGAVEYLGRLDHQVKLRGMRVEPGEVESVIAEHPAVSRAAVVVREGEPGDARLIAYVVLQGQGAGADGLPDDLHDFLRQRLPEYMLPSAFVPLAELPLSPNGKLDRTALPAPPRPAAAARVAPRDEMEHVIAEIWQDVLGHDAIGIDDDFFGLGGHSLLAMSLLARIEAATTVKLALRSLFERPTIRTLAEAVREEAQQQALAAAPS
jgi:acyl-coenzyme A synthetase/AMP-(fatty) acid ligase/acyl carrier protein